MRTMSRRTKIERVAIALALQAGVIVKPKHFDRLDGDTRSAWGLRVYQLLPFLSSAGLVLRIRETYKR
jgi:hypothetical protein